MPNNFFENVKEKVVTARDKAGDALKNGGEQVALQAGKAKHNLEMWWYRPLWERHLEREGYSLPSIINITEDDPRCEQDACSGAVAFDDGTKDKKALTVLSSYADNLGVEFYPTKHESVYYVDPFNEKRYIDLDDYFGYLKEVKVSELKEIAQALGATYIKITLQAEKKVFVSKKKKGDVGNKALGKVNAQQDKDQKSLISLEVVSESRFKGHEPHEPDLEYFDNDQSIKTLIKMRMNQDNPFLGDTYTIKYRNSSELNEKEAIKIDGVLKKLKFSGNITIREEVEQENRQYFNYEIQFPDH